MPHVPFTKNVGQALALLDMVVSDPYPSTQAPLDLEVSLYVQQLFAISGKPHDHTP